MSRVVGHKTHMYRPHMKYMDRVGMAHVVMGRFRARVQSDGVLAAVQYILYLGFLVLSTPFYAFLRRKKTFTFFGRQHPYFCHWYNATFDNERSVEIPLARYFLRQAEGKRVLEVGNVLSHYGSTYHDILDKYEKASGIFHADVVDYRPTSPYDLIVSVSTLEHVGWDEVPRDSTKIVRSVKNLRMMLAPGGLLFATIPVGYNTSITSLLEQECLFTEQYYLKRISRGNDWVETSKQVALAIPFNTPYSFANALVLCLLRRDK